MTRSAFPPSIADDDITSELDCIDRVKEIISGLRATSPWPKIKAAMHLRRIAEKTFLRKPALIDFANALLESETNGNSVEDIIHDEAPNLKHWAEDIQAAKMGEI